MKKIALFFIATLIISCTGEEALMETKKIIFLAHSTGTNLYIQGDVPGWFAKYNKREDTSYTISLQPFPKARIYGWRNYPFDYWNIWVNHNGYKFEPSLDRLAKKYDLIIWKHCYPGSKIQPDPNQPSINEEVKSLEVYKLQYNVLKEKMREYPNTKFLIWTLAVMREEDLSEEEALRTKEFVKWVKNEWDEPGDNIYLWDFYHYETTATDGNHQSLYLRPEFATKDAHPNKQFNVQTAPFFCERIIEVLND